MSFTENTVTRNMQPNLWNCESSGAVWLSETTAGKKAYSGQTQQFVCYESGATCRVMNSASLMVLGLNLANLSERSFHNHSKVCETPHASMPIRSTTMHMQRKTTHEVRCGSYGKWRLLPLSSETPLWMSKKKRI